MRPGTAHRILFVHDGEIFFSRELSPAGLFWYSQDIVGYWIIYEAS